MKRALLFMFLAGASLSTPAQDAGKLHETAQGYLKENDYQNAILVLNRALQLEGNNKEMLKDLVFANYLKKDFATAISLGKPLLERPDADLRSFQLMGLVYKSTADFKESEKLYKRAIKVFPDAGIMYTEYGEVLAEKNVDDAIKFWEKGIDVDPNFSSNYFYVARHYANKNELLWSILYAEMFLNLESYTHRSNEIKLLLLDQYKKFFAATGNPEQFFAAKTNSFTNNVARVMMKQQDQAILGLTPEVLTIIRTRFILEWFDKYAEKFPFRLFDHHRQLLQEGHFEAYNQWVFGAAANNESYQKWQQQHADKMSAYLNFSRNRIFKIPAGQQYRIF